MKATIDNDRKDLIRWIEFSEGNFILKALNSDSSRAIRDYFNIEVLGNIHEHSHLLKSNQ